jgi:hypothetical protein
MQTKGKDHNVALGIDRPPGFIPVAAMNPCRAALPLTEEPMPRDHLERQQRVNLRPILLSETHVNTCVKMRPYAGLPGRQVSLPVFTWRVILTARQGQSSGPS